MKTNAVPAICCVEIGFRKIKIEQRIVKNFRVVVKIEHVNGPNHSIVRKMKFYQNQSNEFQMVFQQILT